MAYFGRKPEKPGSVPGAASGGAEQDVAARVRGLVRKVSAGRTGRPERLGTPSRASRATRAQRSKR